MQALLRNEREYRQLHREAHVLLGQLQKLVYPESPLKEAGGRLAAEGQAEDQAEPALQQGQHPEVRREHRQGGVATSVSQLHPNLQLHPNQNEAANQPSAASTISVTDAADISLDFLFA